MQGLVLEGGGAKGSYQAGAIRALCENNYEFDGVMGTSIGAVNGAIIAQGDMDKCYGIWENILVSNFVDVDDEKMQKVFDKKHDKSSMGYLFKIIRDALKNKGFNINNMITLLKKIIDEDKLRASKTDFGIVTVSLSEKMPLEIFKEEIPYGMLHEYIMASAYFPAFRNDPINGNKYFDGGVYDNLPINPLIRRGYDDIIAIRTMSRMPHRDVIDDTVRINYITPSEALGSTIALYPKSIERNLKLGYYDANKFIKGYKGKRFYFYNETEQNFFGYLSSLNEQTYTDWAKYLQLNSGTAKIEIIENVLSVIRSELKFPNNSSVYELFLLFLERYGLLYKIDKFKIYDIDNFIKEIKVNYLPLDYKSNIINYMKSTMINYMLDNIFDKMIQNY